jgi:hypothetical protein
MTKYKTEIQKRFIYALLLLAFATFCAQSQPIKVNGGNITMTITTGTAGGQLASVVNTVTTLAYKKQAALAKITVATSCPGQSYNLAVIATSVTKGVAAPQVSLVTGSPAVDFITSIPTSGAANATCRLQYTASSLFSQGNSTEVGDDVHTVTYTIMAQ